MYYNISTSVLCTFNNYTCGYHVFHRNMKIVFQYYLIISKCIKRQNFKDGISNFKVGG